MGRLITSESISKGHPDKVADQISDAILDHLLEEDHNSKVAIETMVKDNTVILGGEIRSSSDPDFDRIVKNVVRDIGYNDPEHGFYWKNLTIINLIGKQSHEIYDAVGDYDQLDEELGAGDQGFMVGYATNETNNYMPLGIHISKKIVDYVAEMKNIGPDAKSQVTIEEFEDGSKRVHTILVSAMHSISMNLDLLKAEIKKTIEQNLIGLSKEVFSLIDKNTKIVINPAGKWNTGGPVADCGLTGRKIVADQYGPYCPVGGGAFSGKDASKVDRSGAYLARYIAKNIVASGLAEKCKVEISYMIGVPEPSSIDINTYGFSNDEKLVEIVKNKFAMKPKQIINFFKLTNPTFQKTSNGHFGNNEFPWEKTDMVETLSRYQKELVNMEMVKLPIVEEEKVRELNEGIKKRKSKKK